MSADPLRMLGQLRRYEIDVARRELAGGLQAAIEASAARRAAEAFIVHEMVAATGPETHPRVAAAFAAWRQRGQALADTARATADTAELAVAHGRLAVAAARAAAEIVEALRAEQAQARQAAALRAEQAMLDEHGARAVWSRRSPQ